MNILKIPMMARRTGTPHQGRHGRDRTCMRKAHDIQVKEKAGVVYRNHKGCSSCCG